MNIKNSIAGLLILTTSIAAMAQKAKKSKSNTTGKYFIVNLQGDTTYFKELDQTFWSNKQKGLTVDGVEMKIKPDEIKSCKTEQGLFDRRPLKPKKPTKKLRLMEVKLQKGDYRYYEYTESSPGAVGANGMMSGGSSVTYKFIYQGDTFIAEVKRKNRKELLMKYFGVEKVK